MMVRKERLEMSQARRWNLNPVRSTNNKGRSIQPLIYEATVILISCRVQQSLSDLNLQIA